MLKGTLPMHFYTGLQLFLPGFICWSVNRLGRCYAVTLKEKGYSEKLQATSLCTTDWSVGGGRGVGGVCGFLLLGSGGGGEVFGVFFLFLFFKQSVANT